MAYDSRYLVTAGAGRSGRDRGLHCEGQPYGCAPCHRQKIIQRARRIEMFPESGGIVEEDDSHRYRQILQGNYRVVYRYEQPAATAYVITVIHAARLLDPDTL